MDTLLRGFIWYICLCYQDDMIVLVSTFSEHVEHLDKVLSRLRKVGLQLNSKKCRFGTHQLNVLGHVEDLLDSQGTCPDYNKISVVATFRIPASTKQLQSFLRLLLFLNVQSKFCQYGGITDLTASQKLALFVRSRPGA